MLFDEPKKKLFLGRVNLIFIDLVNTRLIILTKRRRLKKKDKNKHKNVHFGFQTKHILKYMKLFG